MALFSFLRPSYWEHEYTDLSRRYMAKRAEVERLKDELDQLQASVNAALEWLNDPLPRFAIRGALAALTGTPPKEGDDA